MITLIKKQYKTTEGEIIGEEYNELDLNEIITMKEVLISKGIISKSELK